MACASLRAEETRSPLRGQVRSRSPEHRLGDMEAPIVVFDFYGTLFDVASVTDVLRAHTAQPEHVAAEWRKRQLELAFATAANTRPWVDFDDLTREALRDVAARFALRLDDAAHAELMHGWRALEPHADTAAALAALHAGGARLAVLSNGTPAGLEAPLARTGLRDRFEVLLSASAVQTYKPNPLVYDLAPRHFARPPRDITFVSSNDWDARGAAAFGMRTVWCNRGTPSEPSSDRTVGRLDELVAIVLEDRRG